MPRSSRFEMRLSPEKLAAIDSARGDVLRTTWVETAVDMRLAEGNAIAPTPLRAVPAPAPTPIKRKKAAPTPEPEPEVEPDVEAESTPAPPSEPVFPRRPPPRMTGGRKKR